MHTAYARARLGLLLLISSSLCLSHTQSTRGQMQTSAFRQPTPYGMEHSTFGPNLVTHGERQDLPHTGSPIRFASAETPAQVDMPIFVDSCESCGKKGCGRCCCIRCGLFAEWLYLHTTGVDMAYAIPQDGLVVPPAVPIGDVGVADHSWESGIRVGARWALGCYSALEASYTWFESDTNDAIAVGGANVINPLLVHPGTFNVGAFAQTATADYRIQFQTVDLAYRTRWLATELCYLDFLLGGRYGHLEQEFQAVYPFAPPDGTTTDTTRINFDGGGLQFGLAAERYLHAHSSFSIYANGLASILSGEFRSDYVQVNQFNGVEAVIGWQDDRFVPVLEAELGVAWMIRDRLRFSAGYTMKAWFNAVTTPVWVQAVHTNNFVNVEDTITFDGLVLRAELLF